MEGVKFNFGKKELYIPALTLGQVEDNEETLGNFGALPNGAQAKVILDLVSECLKRNYPEMTRDDVKHLITLANMHEVFLALMGVSGLTNAGEAEGENGGN